MELTTGGCPWRREDYMSGTIDLVVRQCFCACVDVQLSELSAAGDLLLVLSQMLPQCRPGSSSGALGCQYPLELCWPGPLYC